MSCRETVPDLGRYAVVVDARSVESNGAIIGTDPVLLEVLAQAARVAPTRVPVLISGESGTGKELLARLIHERGLAPRGPFVAVNCGALPRELADSELFGHEKGAFTGAGARKAGWFEEAHGGTLVLDEIGELPLELQPRLLRVLETGRVRRVGGSGEVAVSVRVVAVTLRDLRREIDRGAFRIDLYHRLAGFELALPPLRRRRHDIPLLVEGFIEDLSRELGPRTIAAEAIEELMRHDWPGNVRELRNVLRRAAIMCPAPIGHVGQIEIDVLNLQGGDGRRLPDLLSRFSAPEPPRLGVAAEGREGQEAGTAGSPYGACPDYGDTLLADGEGPPPPEPLQGDLLHLTGQTFDQIERAVLGWALRRNAGSRRRAARSLALPRSTMCDKVKRYGLG